MACGDKESSLHQVLRSSASRVIFSLKKHQRWAANSFQEHPFTDAFIGKLQLLVEGEINWRGAPESERIFFMLDPFLSLLRSPQPDITIPNNVTLAVLAAIREVLGSEFVVSSSLVDSTAVRSLLQSHIGCLEIDPNPAGVSSDPCSIELIMLEVVRIMRVILVERFTEFCDKESISIAFELLFSVCINFKASSVAKKTILLETGEIIRTLLGSSEPGTGSTARLLPVLIFLIEQLEKASPEGLNFAIFMLSYSLKTEGILKLVAVGEDGRGFFQRLSASLLSLIRAKSSDTLQPIDCDLLKQTVEILVRLINYQSTPDRHFLSSSFLSLSMERLDRHWGRARYSDECEILLYGLLEILQERKFFRFMFDSFDCYPGRPFLLQRFLFWLGKRVVPATGNSFSIHNFLVLRCIRSFAECLCLEREISPQSFFILIKKQLSEQAAAVWNEHDWKKAISKLVENSLITSPEDWPGIARFLYEEPTLSPIAVGMFLGRGKDESKAVLASYVKSHIHFQPGTSLDQALRFFLMQFCLPGESQQIWQLLQAFAAGYYDYCVNDHKTPYRFQSKEAVFILTYSLVMLNTDLHNPSLKSKMSVQQFLKNCESINNGGDFPSDLLSDLYGRISEEEFQRPDSSLKFLKSSNFSDIIVPDSVSAVSFVQDAVDRGIVSALFESCCRLTSVRADQVFDCVFSIATCLFGVVPIYPESISTLLSSGLSVGLYEKSLCQNDRRLLFLVTAVSGQHLQHLNSSIGWPTFVTALETCFKEEMLPGELLQRFPRTTTNASSGEKRKSINSGIFKSLSHLLGTSNLAVPSTVPAASILDPSHGLGFSTLFSFIQDAESVSLETFISLLDFFGTASAERKQTGAFFLYLIAETVAKSSTSRVAETFPHLLQLVSRVIRAERSFSSIAVEILINSLLMLHGDGVDAICWDLLCSLIRTHPNLFFDHTTVLLRDIAEYQSNYSQPLIDSFIFLLQAAAKEKTQTGRFIDSLELIVGTNSFLTDDQSLEIIAHVNLSLLSDSLALRFFNCWFSLFTSLLEKDHVTKIFSLLPLLVSCLDMSDSIRQLSLTTLQRSCLHSDLILALLRYPNSGDDQCTKLFSEILFPCMLSATDSEAKQRLLTIVTKTFLSATSHCDGSSTRLCDTWVRLQDLLAVYHEKGPDGVREAVVETLKNAALVLLQQKFSGLNLESTSGWMTIQRVLPSLYSKYHQISLPSLPPDSQPTSTINRNQEIYI